VLVGGGNVEGRKDVRDDHASFKVAEAGLGGEAGAKYGKAKLEAYGKAGVKEALSRCHECGSNLEGPGKAGGSGSDPCAGDFEACPVYG